MKKQVYAVAIIGSGPAGLTAGIYTARAGLEPCIIEGNSPGGQLMSTTLVENWPGTPSIMGPQLMIAMRKQTEEAGCTIIPAALKSLNTQSTPFTLTLSDQTIIQAKTVIIATGATPKRLNCPGENIYWGKGVTPCAVCDGALYKGQPVVIVGGGDTAMESASFMLKMTNKITIVQIESKLSASHAMQKKIINNPSIQFLYNSTVASIEGNGNQIEAITVKNVQTGQESTLKAKALFLAIGLKPNTEVFNTLIKMDKAGYITISEKSHTSVPGIFAAGDVVDMVYRQAVTAAGDGCKAALDVQRFLEEQE